MKPNPFQRMDLWVRHMLPLGTALTALLLTLVPMRLPGLATVAPALVLMTVFYWAIYRPDLMPPWLAFLVGLLGDMLAGSPLGVNALILLLTQGATAAQRKFFLGNTFLVAWWGFSLTAAAAFALAWLLSSLLIGRPAGSGAVLFQYFSTLFFYPVVGWLLARAQVAVLTRPA